MSTRLGAFQEAALLVLLARSTGAQIVAADLLSVDRAGLGARGGAGPRGGCRHRGIGAVASTLLPERLANGGRRERRPDRSRFLPCRSHLEELLHHHFLQVLDHLLEDVERFLLVLRQRIALAIAAQPDALLEVVHVEQVLTPELVDAAEAAALPLEPGHDPAF